MSKESRLEASRKLGQYLQRIDKLIRQSADRRIAQAGLTVAQDAVLVFLAARRDQETHQIDIQNFLHLTNPAVTKMCHRLAEKELIRITPGTKDQRYNTVSLTDKGMAAYELGSALKAPLEENTLKGFTDDEITVLLELMERLLDNVSETCESD